jgi:hypothetical protein
MSGLPAQVQCGKVLARSSGLGGRDSTQYADLLGTGIAVTPSNQKKYG